MEKEVAVQSEVLESGGVGGLDDQGVWQTCVGWSITIMTVMMTVMPARSAAVLEHVKDRQALGVNRAVAAFPEPPHVGHGSDEIVVEPDLHAGKLLDLLEKHVEAVLGEQLEQPAQLTCVMAHQASCLERAVLDENSP